MPQIVTQLGNQQLRVIRPDAIDLKRADSELRRLADAGHLLQLSKGFYTLVPENRRRKPVTWRPTIEGAALGMAAALYGPDAVALVGPSAARAHRCYPRALGAAYVTVPQKLRTRETAVGSVSFVNRAIDKMDTVRVDTDLGSGWATSIENSALDLCRNRPDWKISEATRSEMINQLAKRIDWELIEDLAVSLRAVKTLARLKQYVEA